VVIEAALTVAAEAGQVDTTASMVVKEVVREVIIPDQGEIIRVVVTDNVVKAMETAMVAIDQEGNMVTSRARAAATTEIVAMVMITVAAITLGIEVMTTEVTAAMATMTTVAAITLGIEAMITGVTAAMATMTTVVAITQGIEAMIIGVTVVMVMTTVAAITQGIEIMITEVTAAMAMTTVVEAMEMQTEGTAMITAEIRQKVATGPEEILRILTRKATLPIDTQVTIMMKTSDLVDREKRVMISKSSDLT